jgi:hypothetical protein
MAEWSYTRKTDREIHELALAVLAGQIWSDRDGDPLRMFLPLRFGAGPELAASLESLGELAMIYEHVDEAVPIAINGCPQFFSCNFLDTHDVHRLAEKIDQLAPPSDDAVSSSKSHE